MTVFQIGTTAITETQRGGVTRYALDHIRIYRIRVESMPGFFANMYLLLDGEASLIDVGSHSPEARADLKKGMEVINRDFHEDIGLGDVANLIITHRHGDHFMGLACEEMHGKKVYMHPYDIGFMTEYAALHDEWMQASMKLAKEAGDCFVRNEETLFTPENCPIRLADYEVVEVEGEQEIINGYRVYHTPGHSSGHICLKVGPVLFLGDHILSSTTPHQTPRSRGQGLGLEAYLASLRKIAAIEESLGLAGHEDTIYNMKDRALEIEAFHHQRLRELVDLCRGEKNLYQLTDEYYKCHPEFIGVSSIAELIDWHRFSAIEEIMAHVEYLLDHNRVIVSGNDKGVVKYRSL